MLETPLSRQCPTASSFPELCVRFAQCCMSKLSNTQGKIRNVKNIRHGILFIDLPQANRMSQGRGNCLDESHPAASSGLVPWLLVYY